MHKFLYFVITITLTTYYMLLATANTVRAAQTSFPVGTMGSDVIPHQIVRTNNDKVYMFGYSGDYSTVIIGRWTNAAGLPNATSDFSGSTQVTENEGTISVEVAYDGANIIHVLSNTGLGKLRDYPFDIQTNTFKTPIVITLDAAHSQIQVGTSGLSAMFAANNTLHIAYWATNNTIKYQSFSYNSGINTLSPISLLTTLSGSESNNLATHPALAISPLDGSITVAWVVGTNGAGNLYARTFSAGNWSTATKLNTAALWTSPNFGINIDQGPSMIISSDGTTHLAYIQDWENVGGTYDYGRVHYVTKTGSTWNDQALSIFSHDPALGLDSSGKIYLVGHGHPFNQSTTCIRLDDMCLTSKSGTTWGQTQLFATHPTNGGFDTSPSVKWSVIGFNRPDVLEFIFPNTIGGSYSNTQIYYARVTTSTNPTPTPTLAPTPTPTPTPTPSPTPFPTPFPTRCKTDINRDKIVDLSDYTLLSGNFLKSNPINPRIDINADGYVDLSDYSLLAANFLKTTTDCGF